VSGPRQILALAAFPERAAATRFRVTAYRSALEARGFTLHLHPFLDDEAFANFYSPIGAAQKARYVAAAMARQLPLLLRDRYDAVFVQREAGLVGPAALEWALSRLRGLPLVFDFDDAIWMTGAWNSQHPTATRLLRAPGKANHLIRWADHAIAGSNRLAEYARTLQPNVSVVPTVVSRELWRPPEGPPGEIRNEVPVIGWVGTHSTAIHLHTIAGALRRVRDTGHSFRLRLIGVPDDFRLEGLECEIVPWRLEDEVDLFRDLDIGIAPTFKHEFTEGKCAFKQLEYLSVGVPCVSSPARGAVDLLTEGETALFAESEDEWVRALSRLLTEQALRRHLAIQGRALIERELCSEMQGPRVVEVFETVTRG
jgi:glycosyltransferase involved in cell wall biosynthesis